MNVSNSTTTASVSDLSFYPFDTPCYSIRSLYRSYHHRRRHGERALDLPDRFAYSLSQFLKRAPEHQKAPMSTSFSTENHH